MPTLAEAQANFIATINDGPAVLDPEIFAGNTERVLLGLKAHANTISHARLVALEETFPRTREALGHEAFNQLTRAYCDTAAAKICDNSALGGPFIDFLQGEFHGQSAPDPAIIDLAHLEWLWLESYNAAEARLLELSALAGLEEHELLEMPIQLHPALRMLQLSAPLSEQLPELADHSEAHAILITRPEGIPVFTPATELQAQLITRSKKQPSVGNLLELVLEQGSITEPLAPVIQLINAGAFAAQLRDET